MRLIVEINERAEEIVPGALKGEDGDGGHGRHGQGQNDVKQDLECIGPIHARGILQLYRQGQEKLAEQEDVEGRAKKGGDNQRLEAVDPAELAEDDEDGHHGDGVREHHGGEQNEKKDILARRTHARKAIGDERGRKQIAQDRKERDEEGVERIAAKRNVGQGFTEISPARRNRQPARRKIEHGIGRLERGDDHPVKRQQEDKSASQKDDVHEQLELALTRGVCVVHASRWLS